MKNTTPYLYLRALRQVDHTVFCVSDGQNTYRDPLTGFPQPYSSGQQVKRSILDNMVELLDEARAPVTFNWELNTKPSSGDKEKLSQKEPHSPCDPAFADQLIGGYMRAQSGMTPIKRRSPLSISAMRPLHPALANTSAESLTFDRTNHPEDHKIVVRDESGNILSNDKVFDFLKANNRALPMRIWIPEDKVGKRASGLFVYDVAIDLRTLFTVSLNVAEPELDEAKRAELLEKGWLETEEKDPISGKSLRLICPKEKRDAIIPALAKSLVEWRITSNQSRTYSPMNTLAVAIGDNANRIGAAIRADLYEEETERPRALPVIDPGVPGVELFTALTARGYVRGVTGAADALEQAEQYLVDKLSSFDYR